MVEFRKSDWYSRKVIDGMKSRNIPLVSLDMLELPKLPPQMDMVTASLVYIRLHERNKEAWWGNDDHARYDYLYTDEEIEAWAERIKRIAGQAQRILIYFNNHLLGKAARNAEMLIMILTKLGIMDKEQRAESKE